VLLFNMLEPSGRDAWRGLDVLAISTHSENALSAAAA
jgi:hypothetical protein